MIESNEKSYEAVSPQLESNQNLERSVTTTNDITAPPSDEHDSLPNDEPRPMPPPTFVFNTIHGSTQQPQCFTVNMNNILVTFLPRGKLL